MSRWSGFRKALSRRFWIRAEAIPDTEKTCFETITLFHGPQHESLSQQLANKHQAGLKSHGNPFPGTGHKLHMARKSFGASCTVH